MFYLYMAMGSSSLWADNGLLHAKIAPSQSLAGCDGALSDLTPLPLGQPLNRGDRPYQYMFSYVVLDDIAARQGLRPLAGQDQARLIRDLNVGDLLYLARTDRGVYRLRVVARSESLLGVYDLDRDRNFQLPINEIFHGFAPTEARNVYWADDNWQVISPAQLYASLRFGDEIRYFHIQRKQWVSLIVDRSLLSVRRFFEPLAVTQAPTDGRPRFNLVAMAPHELLKDMASGTLTIRRRSTGTRDPLDRAATPRGSQDLERIRAHELAEIQRRRGVSDKAAQPYNPYLVVHSLEREEWMRFLYANQDLTRLRAGDREALLRAKPSEPAAWELSFAVRDTQDAEALFQGILESSYAVALLQNPDWVFGNIRDPRQMGLKYQLVEHGNSLWLQLTIRKEDPLDSLALVGGLAWGYRLSYLSGR